jgi:hypothetical protein
MVLQLKYMNARAHEIRTIVQSGHHVASRRKIFASRRPAAMSANVSISAKVLGQKFWGKSLGAKVWGATSAPAGRSIVPDSVATLALKQPNHEPCSTVSHRMDELRAIITMAADHRFLIIDRQRFT